jgi:hypothetical protein
MPEPTRRDGSLVEVSARTQKVISPAWSFNSPLLRGIIAQPGGKILETRTRLPFSIPASRRESSKLCKRFLWRPAPLVKKQYFGTIVIATLFRERNVVFYLMKIDKATPNSHVINPKIDATKPMDIERNMPLTMFSPQHLY